MGLAHPLRFKTFRPYEAALRPEVPTTPRSHWLPFAPIQVLGSILVAMSCALIGSAVVAGPASASVNAQAGPVDLATPTVWVTDNSQSISTGGTLVFTATVTGPSGGATPTGAVTWAVTAPGGDAVPCSSTTGPTGSSNVGTYSCSIVGILAGAYTTTVAYPGDSDYGPATGTDNGPLAACTAIATGECAPSATSCTSQTGDPVDCASGDFWRSLRLVG